MQVVKHLRHKEATNQSLNQKSRCFYIGAFFFLRACSQTPGGMKVTGENVIRYKVYKSY